MDTLIEEIKTAATQQAESFVRKAQSGLRAVNPNVEKISSAFSQMLMSSEKLIARIHGTLSIIKKSRGVSNWFSKKIGNLHKISASLKEQENKVKEAITDINAWLKRHNVTVETSIVDEAVLAIATPPDANRKIKGILEQYNAVLSNGESIGNRAEELQETSMQLLEEISKLDISKNPWVEALKTQVWEAKDELGVFAYQNDNYQKIQGLFEQFTTDRNPIDEYLDAVTAHRTARKKREGDDVISALKSERSKKRRLALKQRAGLIQLIENLGIEIDAWEDQNLAFDTFEVKEHSKRIESIRRIITSFLKDDLKKIFAKDPSEVDDLLTNPVFLDFSNAKKYDESVRKFITESLQLIEVVKTQYQEKVVNISENDHKNFSEKSVEKILQNCNLIDLHLSNWTNTALRCDIKAAGKVFTNDQKQVLELSASIKTYRDNTRDIVNLILSYNSNKKVITDLNKSISAIKTNLDEAKESLSSASDPQTKGKIVMQIAKLRSDYIEQEERLQAATNLLVTPYKRLKEAELTSRKSFPTKMLTTLEALTNSTVATDIETAVNERLNEHNLRYKNIIDAYQLYQNEKANKTKEENQTKAEEILSAIYIGEQAITAEDSFREKLLEENPGYASMMPEDLKTKFKEKLESYKLIRINLNDDIEAALNNKSPLKEELYENILEICDDNKGNRDIDAVFATKTKANKLYQNWLTLSKIDTGTTSITTGDYETQNKTLVRALKRLNNRLNKVGERGGYHESSLSRVQKVDFDLALKSTLDKLAEIERAIHTTDLEQKVTEYTKLQNGASDPSDQKMFEKIVYIHTEKLKIAQAEQEKGNALVLQYKDMLQTPTVFAKEINPVQKILSIKAEIETALKNLVQQNLDALRDAEGEFFAAFGKDFDFYRSTKGGRNDVLSTQKNDVLGMMGLDIINRFNSLEKMGATKEELRKSVEHIPVSMWPDEVLETLQAWEKVKALTKANLEAHTEQLKQENEDMALAIMNEKDVAIEGINKLIGLSDNATAFKEQAESFLGEFLSGMENAGKLQEAMLNLLGDTNGLVKQYHSTPERLCQILVAVKNSKEVVESLISKVKTDDDSDETSTGDTISSTIDSVIENMETFMEKWMDEDSDNMDKGLAVLTLANSTGTTIADLVDEDGPAGKYFELVGTGLAAVGDIKDVLTNEELGKRDKTVKMLSVVGTITGSLSGEDGLLSGTEAGKVLDIATNIIKSINIANDRFNDIFGAEKLSRDEIEDRLSRTPDLIRDLKTEVLGPLGTAVEIVGDVNQVMQLFNAGLDLAPGLSIASNVLGLMSDLADIANTVKEREEHKTLHNETILYGDDEALSMGMRQNVNHDSMKLAQQSIDAFAQTVSLAGSVVELAGPVAPVGMALKYAGTAITIGAKVFFAAIDEAQVKIVQNLVREAQKGNRNAKITIFKRSAYYAKMYVIGLAKEGAEGNKAAESLAREYCLGYGISDDTLKEESVELILRKIFQSTGEHDDRYSKIGGGIKTLISMIKGKLNKLQGEELLNQLIIELDSDIDTLNTRLLELEETLNKEKIDDIVKGNKLKEAKMPLHSLRNELITHRTNLEKLELAGTATAKQIEKIQKIQKLIDTLGKHGI